MEFLKTYRPFYIRNLKVALPIMLTQAGQVIVQLADNIMIGHLGTNELAGVSFANSLFIIGIIFCTGFTQGTTPHVGQAYGRGDFRLAGNMFQNSLALNLATSIIVTLFLTALRFFMPMMGQDEAVLEYAYTYYDIMLLSIVPFIMFLSIRQFSEGIGITKYAMYLTLAANILNIFLNWVLIYGKLGMPEMGVAGAATATLVSRIAMIAGFVCILFMKYPYRHYLKYFSRDAFRKDTAKSILHTSLPLSIQSLTEICAFSFSTIMAGWIGATALASYQIAMSLSSLMFMIALGIGAAATIRVSHQYGAGHFEDSKKAGIASMHLSIALMGISGLTILAFREYIPMLYSSDPAVISLTSSLLVVVAVYQVFDATQLSSLACLRALADVKVPMIMSTVAYFLICLPMGYVLGFHAGFGPHGILAGLMCGLLFAGIFFYTRFIRLINRIIKANER